VSDVDTLENIIVEYVGPFAKHVLKKQVKDLSINREAASQSDLIQLTDAVIENAIFDPKLQDEARRKIRKQIRLTEVDGPIF